MILIDNVYFIWEFLSSFLSFCNIAIEKFYQVMKAIEFLYFFTGHCYLSPCMFQICLRNTVAKTIDIILVNLANHDISLFISYVTGAGFIGN